MRKPSAVLLTVTALALAAGAPAAQANVVDCDAYADFPNVKISSARGLTCAGAVKVMKAYKGEISKTFQAPRSFTCTRVSGSEFGGQWRCAKGAQAFRFEFRD
jgi:hypothetical protein